MQVQKNYFMRYINLSNATPEDLIRLESVMWNNKKTLNYVFLHKFTKDPNHRFTLQVQWLLANFGPKKSGRYDYVFNKRNWGVRQTKFSTKRIFPVKVGTIIRDEEDAMLFRLRWA
jgi:hypothetical protein